MRDSILIGTFLCVGIATGCTSKEASCEPFCRDGSVTPDGGSGARDWPATTLAVDCRPTDMDPSGSDSAQCQGPIGSGTSLTYAGGGIAGGYYDATARLFVIHGTSAIMTVTRDGVSAMLSGAYEDPATGAQTAGSGPMWPADSLVAVRQWTDGNVIAMAGDGFYFVNRETGTRSFYRDYSGVPTDTNNIREEAGFAVDESGALYVALTRTTADGGVGVFRFTASSSSVVTLSGAGDTTRHVGSGPDDGISGYVGIQYHAGSLWLLNPDRDGLLSVDIATGARRYVSRPDVGSDLDGVAHPIAENASNAIDVFFDASDNAAYVIAYNIANPAGHYQTKIDLATGDRSFINQYFAFYTQPVWFGENLDRSFGRPLGYDEAAGIVYTTPYRSQIRAIDLAAANFNLVHSE